VCLVILLRSGAKLEFCGMEMKRNENEVECNQTRSGKKWGKNLKAQAKSSMLFSEGTPNCSIDCTFPPFHTFSIHPD